MEIPTDPSVERLRTKKASLRFLGSIKGNPNALRLTSKISIDAILMGEEKIVEKSILT